ncbi:MAG: hypothetical protein AB7K86_08445 [Rhodospirillales bacterium]
MTITLKTLPQATAQEGSKRALESAPQPAPSALASAPGAVPVAYIQRDHLQKARRAPFLCRVEPTRRHPDFDPVYTAPPATDPAGDIDDKAHPRFMAGYDAGLRDGRAIAAREESEAPLPDPAGDLLVPEREAVHVECRECRDCEHVGINDESSTDATCSMCDWSGPSPADDHCPQCHRDGTMGAACPKCGGRYGLIAEAALPGPVGPAGDPLVPEREADIIERAIKQTWEMIDPLNPPGEPGSYWRGQHNGIAAALKTLRANLDALRAAGQPEGN